MILVTGGTGLVGSHLLYFLLKDNKKVRAVHRASSNLELVRKVFGYYTDTPDSLFEKIDWVEANITDLPALTEAFSGITHVYHAAAYISFDPKNYRKLKKSNVEGTANVVNLCLHFGIEKLCYVSSIATLGNSVNGAMITEETHWNPEEDNSVYAITKYGAEMEVWRGTQEGLKAVIVNPGVILGEGHWRSGSSAIVSSVARGVPFYTTGGVGIVDVLDVVKAMIDLMESEVVNQRFVLVAQNITYKDMLVGLSEHLNRKPPKRSIAKWKLVGLSKLDWLSAKLLGSKRRLLRSMVESLYTMSNYDASKIQKEINFEYTPVETTFERVTRYYSMES